ncbi:pentatricopeptide repeat-containing protein At2g44880-like [Magnolia sinica]|uniref:pentatricopeptide repeat-containing protein At2g44880-like n=1 Tax=Magnolia sinica TaxID=86752 RepID=UPI00265A0863|nr:pentatricopeptide repeat-containing protein At2g44880-like [Magnolia sinica]
MLSQGSVPPDKFTFPFLLKACTRLQALHEGEQMHSHILKSGLASDPVVRNVLINVYAQIGMLESARRVFDRNPQRDSVSWNSLIGGYLKHGHLEEAGRLFSQMPHQKTLFSWNIMISGYAKSGRPELAKSLLHQLASEFSNINSLISLTCLISLYVEVGEVEAARRVFDSMDENDIVCWSCMISGYVRSGHYMEALWLFKEMQQVEENIKPDKVLLVSIVSE